MCPNRQSYVYYYPVQKYKDGTYRLPNLVCYQFQ